ncbi:hypothetical protein [Syntrophus aciditrophicus]|uniref:Hypothetical membrane protein n=1 Tax=Syntrophus aciditrophicus (strain SB) TaxID=56780 RepID=Q2LUB8_SYNAS|nr:hypothetical protein [Syntrophus aciditrophicus]ABC77678.1 hypothetical membrane protein [Syntrophus aciditrophicus SB]
MNAIASTGIGTAFLILFNLLYFVLIMNLVSLFIERIWIGRSQWIILPVIAVSLVVFYVYPTLFRHIIEAVTGPFSISGLLIVTGLGMLAGMLASSL